MNALVLKVLKNQNKTVIDIIMRPFRSLNYIFVLILIPISSCHHHDYNRWPLIKEESKNYHFVSNDDEKFTMTIFDKDGNKPLYCLDARFNAWKYDTSDYNFSGLFDCRLYLVDSNNTAYPTLFQNVEHATRDWQTDGRFLHSELLGLANARSSRSLIQRCKLRGMLIEIEINNIASKGDIVKSLDFKITFKNFLSTEPVIEKNIIRGQGD